MQSYAVENVARHLVQPISSRRERSDLDESRSIIASHSSRLCFPYWGEYGKENVKNKIKNLWLSDFTNCHYFIFIIQHIQRHRRASISMAFLLQTCDHLKQLWFGRQSDLPNVLRNVDRSKLAQLIKLEIPFNDKSSGAYYEVHSALPELMPNAKEVRWLKFDRFYFGLKIVCDWLFWRENRLIPNKPARLHRFSSTGSIDLPRCHSSAHSTLRASGLCTAWPSSRQCHSGLSVMSQSRQCRLACAH